MAETIESPEISLADYRALREGRDLPPKVNTSEAPAAAAEPPPAASDAETAAEPESAETTEGSQEQEQPPEKPKPAPPKRGMIDEIAALRAKNRELEARLNGSKPAQPPAEVPPPAAAENAPADDPEPDVDKYTDYVLFQKDWNRWDRRQELRREAAEKAKADAAAAERARANVWSERVAVAKRAHEDFETVALNVDLPVTPVMGQAITDTEIGAEILYYLGSHPEESARIAKLTPLAQIREIGKLELTLSAKEEPAAAEPEQPVTPTPVSKAPAPVARPQAGATRSDPRRNVEGMSLAEYRAYRESGKIR